MIRRPRGWRRNDRKVWRSKRGDLCAGERRRSQSPRSTAAVKAARGAGSKAAPREGRIGRWKREFDDEAKRKPSAGSAEKATQGAEAHRRAWSWVEASVWNERMLAALENGVKGGKWFSLIPKCTESNA